MIYIFCAILCSASIALLFKYSEGENCNRYVLTSANYFTATLIMIFINRNIPYLSLPKISGSVFEGADAVWFGSILGIFAGVLYCVSFFYYQIAVKNSGAGLASAFGKIGIIIPMIFSAFIWREYPNSFQITGILMALFSILFLYIKKEDIEGKNMNLSLLIFFCLCGLGEFTTKIYQKYASLSFKNHFIMIIFLFAFILSILIGKYKKSLQFDLKSVILGSFVGIPNLLNSYFLLLALQKINTSVVFSTFSAGTIIIVNIVSHFLFKEKKTRKELFVLLAMILAVFIINVS